MYAGVEKREEDSIRAMGLRDIEATLPPGFRFYPSDEELVCHYLFNKIARQDALQDTLVEIDLHTCEPWQLPEVAKLNASEWYFFSFRDRKYATGYRTNRATGCGYWKATGKDRAVVEAATQQAVGMRKTLVFYRNRAPHGLKTPWIMHEFRLHNPHLPPMEDWVLCRVFHKGKVGSTNTGEQLLPVNAMYPRQPPLTALPSHNDTGCSTSQSSFPDSSVCAAGDLTVLRALASEMQSPPGENPEAMGFLWDMNFDGTEDLEELGEGCDLEDENMGFLQV